MSLRTAVEQSVNVAAVKVISQVGFDYAAAQLERMGVTTVEKKNRELLRTVMRKAGFKTITTEWWHFNRIRRPEARQNYKVIP